MSHRLCTTGNRDLPPARPALIARTSRDGTGVCFFLTVLLACILLSGGCVPDQAAMRMTRQKNAADDVKAIQEAARPAPIKPPPAQSSWKSPAAKPSPLPDLSKPLTLNGAVILALANNLDALVAAQEKVINEELATGAKRRMLPSLMVDAEQSWKSRETPSSSVSFETRQTSLEPSISSDLWTTTVNATLAWDMVNLGVNVYRSSQAGSRVLISDSRLRRIKQNIALDVVRAYLKTASARDVVVLSGKLIKDANERRKVLEAHMNDDILSRAEGLSADIDALELAARYHGFEEQYQNAKAKLAEVMGIDPATPFEIAGIDFETLPVFVQADGKDVESAALARRPELYETDLDQGISRDEASAAQVQMNPALSPFVRFTYDANTYLLRHDWFVYGLKLSWDLLSVPRLISDKRAALDKAAQDRLRRLKTTQAIMVQSRLAVLDIQQLSGMLPITRDIERKRKELLDLVNLQVQTGKSKETVLLEEGNKYLSARIRYLGVYSDLLAAKARLRNTMGLDWDEAAPTPALGAAMDISPSPARTQSKMDVPPAGSVDQTAPSPPAKTLKATKPAPASARKPSTRTLKPKVATASKRS